MPTPPNMRQVGIVVEPELADEFAQQATSRGQVKNKAGRAMLKLWLDLPIEVQSKLIAEEPLVEGETESNLERLIEHVFHRLSDHSSVAKKKRVPKRNAGQKG